VYSSFFNLGAVNSIHMEISVMWFKLSWLFLRYMQFSIENLPSLSFKIEDLSVFDNDHTGDTVIFEVIGRIKNKNKLFILFSRRPSDF
jgi:hypothetical protein